MLVKLATLLAKCRISTINLVLIVTADTTDNLHTDLCGRPFEVLTEEVEACELELDST